MCVTILECLFCDQNDIPDEVFNLTTRLSSDDQQFAYPIDTKRVSQATTQRSDGPATSGAHREDQDRTSIGLQR